MLGWKIILIKLSDDCLRHLVRLLKRGTKIGELKMKRFLDFITSVLNAMVVLTGIFMFPITGIALFIAIHTVWGWDLFTEFFYVFNAVAFTMVIGLIAMIPSRGQSILGMLIVGTMLVASGCQTTYMALLEVPDIWRIIGAFVMSGLLAVTHVTLWMLVRHFGKVDGLKPATIDESKVKP